MGRSLKDIEKDIHAFEAELDALDGDHDGHADNPQFEDRLHQTWGMLQSLGKELQAAIKEEQKKKLSAQPTPGAGAGETSFSKKEKDGTKVGVKVDDKGISEVSFGNEQEDKDKKVTTSASITIGRDKLAAEWGKEKELWKKSTPNIPLGAVGPIPISAKLTSTGKAGFKIGSEVTPGQSKLSIDGTFTASGSVELFADFKIAEFGGSSGVEASATIGASVTFTAESYEIEINPFTGQVYLVFKIFLRAPETIREAADALGISLEWSKTLAKYNILSIGVPKYAQGKIQGDFTVSKGADVDKLLNSIQEGYDYIKNAISRAYNWAGETAHETYEGIKSIWNRITH